MSWTKEPPDSTEGKPYRYYLTRFGAGQVLEMACLGLMYEHARRNGALYRIDDLSADGLEWWSEPIKEPTE